MKINGSLTHSNLGSEELASAIPWRFLIYTILTLIASGFIAESISEFAHLPEQVKPLAYTKELKEDPARSIKKEIIFESYNFSNAIPFSKRVDLGRISELDKETFKKQILQSTPKKLRVKLVKYIDLAIDLSEKYSVDPFWVIAIMWTESHFNHSARSYVAAGGLMQIMPATGVELSRKLNLAKRAKHAKRLVYVPKYNIEMGTFYMKHLLNTLWNSPKLATVAYNMGPNRVKWRIRKNKEVGVRNLYLNKVRRAYSSLSREFVNYQKNTPRPYRNTYVAQNSNLIKQNQYSISFL